MAPGPHAYEGNARSLTGTPGDIAGGSALRELGDGDPARAYLALGALDDATLRARAESAWRAVYGGEIGGISAR
jgi:hypothetical protein